MLKLYVCAIETFLFLISATRKHLVSSVWEVSKTGRLVVGEIPRLNADQDIATPMLPTTEWPSSSIKAEHSISRGIMPTATG